MPTRVLTLWGDCSRPSVRLVESKGQKGRYIALSHCWGSTRKQPLRTTPENFRVHRSGISFEDLPKTFQDLVELAQAVGIRRVWIDSLCIIQGDSQDWLSEAAKMGDVYRNAALVIAASGAQDSTEGLFITDRPRATVYRIPYRLEGRIDGTFNITQWPLYNLHPQLGPLETRAWTLQERHLARRLVCFMPGGLTWMCRGHTINEAGDRVGGFAFEKSWTMLLREYTQRSLTFPSDRTEALIGIAEEFQLSPKEQRYGMFNTREEQPLLEHFWELAEEFELSRRNRYMAKYGVWEAKLPLQLLWSNNGPCFDDDGKLPDKPSWSWAATKNPKTWPDAEYDARYQDVKRAERMPKRLLITPFGHLQISGHLSTTHPALSYVRDTTAARDLSPDEFERTFFDSSSIDDSNPRGAFHTVTQQMQDVYHQEVLGIARFDHDETTLYTHAFFLAKQKRMIRGVSNPRVLKIRWTRFINERRGVRPDAVVKVQTIVRSHHVHVVRWR